MAEADDCDAPRKFSGVRCVALHGQILIVQANPMLTEPWGEAQRSLWQLPILPRLGCIALSFADPLSHSREERAVCHAQ